MPSWPHKRIGGRIANAQPGWHTVGGQRLYFRSKAELRHATILELQRTAGVVASWEHEPKRFDFPIKRGNNSYLPDFRVVYSDGRTEWHEVKGWLDPASKTKLRRFARYYPGEALRVIGARWPEAPPGEPCKKSTRLEK